MIKLEMKILTKSSLVDLRVSRTTVTPSLVSSICVVKRPTSFRNLE